MTCVGSDVGVYIILTVGASLVETEVGVPEVSLRVAAQSDRG